MAFKDILLALTTYPDPTPIPAVQYAVGMANALGGKISAIACDVRIKPAGNPVASYVLDIPSLVAGEEEKSRANADKLLAAFKEEAERKGVFLEQIREKSFSSDVPDVLVDHARLRDVTIVPVPEGDYFDQWYAESIIFGSGRPTIVLPQSRTGEFTCNTMVIAWDYSRPAARAVADAMPILQKAKRVHILTVTNEKELHAKRSEEGLRQYLGRHGIDASADHVDAQKRRIGKVFEQYVTDRNADLLIMGAYGHSRIRQFVLGGATMSMLSRPPVPLFLSH